MGEHICDILFSSLTNLSCYSSLILQLFAYLSSWYASSYLIITYSKSYHMNHRSFAKNSWLWCDVLDLWYGGYFFIFGAV